jgi:hypothetical protein
MPAYRVEDANQQSILCKDGEPSFQMLCLNLQEAVIEVEDRWSNEDHNRARFKIAGRRYLYAWSDLEPHLD